MEERMVKIVVVKHPNCVGHFVFKVPEFVELQTGALVYMDTKRGKDQPARCITPSFYIDVDLLKDAYGMTADKLRLVKGELAKYEYKTDEEYAKCMDACKEYGWLKSFDAR